MNGLNLFQLPFEVETLVRPIIIGPVYGVGLNWVGSSPGTSMSNATNLYLQFHYSTCFNFLINITFKACNLEINLRNDIIFSELHESN